jgi:hypothetical protein
MGRGEAGKSNERLYQFITSYSITWTINRATNSHFYTINRVDPRTFEWKSGKLKTKQYDETFELIDK